MDKELQLKIRNEIQEEAVKLAGKNDHVLLEWATGCGKTLAALKIMERYEGRWLIVCKETNHVQNWWDDIKKHGIDESNIVDIICYASLHKFTDMKGINMILDEVHGLSELREDYVGQIKPNRICSLSATVDGAVRARLHAIKPFVIYDINMSYAIELGLLPEPKIYVVKLKLDDAHRTYSIKTKKFSTKLTAKKYYEYLSKNVSYWQERAHMDGSKWIENRYMMSALNRKKWITTQKTEVAKWVRDKIRDRRYICFTGTIDQCNELGGEYVVHSKVTTVRRQLLIDKLNSGEINHLYCVNMMRESMNINAIEAGMIIQLDGSSDRSFIQSLGRTLRGDKPEFFILVVEGTKDEDYLKTALQDIDPKYIKYIHYENS